MGFQQEGSVGRGEGFNPQVYNDFPESCGCAVSSLSCLLKDRPWPSGRPGDTWNGTLGRARRRHRRSAVSFGPPEGLKEWQGILASGCGQRVS